MTPIARLSSRLIFLRWVPGFALMNCNMRTLLESSIWTTSVVCALAHSTHTATCWVKNVWEALLNGINFRGIHRIPILSYARKKKRKGGGMVMLLHSTGGLE